MYYNFLQIDENSKNIKTCIGVALVSPSQSKTKNILENELYKIGLKSANICGLKSKSQGLYILGTEDLMINGITLDNKNVKIVAELSSGFVLSSTSQKVPS